MPSRSLRRAAAVVVMTAAVPAAVATAHSRVASAAGTFGTPVVVGSGASEPGVHVAPDGTLYVEGPTGLLSNLPGSPSDIWRSTDGGATWTLTPPGIRADLPGGGDSTLAVNPTSGALAWADLWLGSSTVGTSTDRAQTWLAQPLGGTVVQDRQWVGLTAGGNAYLAYHQIPAGIVVSRSVDGGLVYPVSTVAATAVDQTGCICPPGNLIAEGGGGLLSTGDKVGVIFATSTDGVKFARSTNGGLTFSVSTVASGSANTGTAFPVVANAGGGHLVATWLENDGASVTRVGLARSSDWGATWTGQTYIVTGGASVYPWVAASGSKVAVTLYHTATTGTPDTVPAGTQWYETFLESTDGGATFSGLVTVDPTPVKTGPICTAGTGCASDRELGDFQSVAIDGAGNAVAAYNRVAASGVDVMFAKEA